MEHNCHVEPRERKFATAEYQKTDVALLAVSGMGCPTCAARVRNGLISLYGVTDVTVNHMTGWVRIVFNPDLMVGIPALIEAVAQAGSGTGHIYHAMPFEYDGQEGENNGRQKNTCSS